MQSQNISNFGDVQVLTLAGVALYLERPCCEPALFLAGLCVTPAVSLSLGELLWPPVSDILAWPEERLSSEELVPQCCCC